MKQVIHIFILLCINFIVCAQRIDINHLSLDEKIGQLFIVASVTDELDNILFMFNKSYRLDKEYIEQLIKDYKIGGIIWLGKSRPEDQIMRTQFYQEINMCNKIPLWFAQDLEPSFMARFGLPELPNNATLGKLNDLAVTQNVGTKIGQYAQQLGVQLVLAPVADLHIHPESTITQIRSFGTDPELVALHAGAFIQGIQNTGALACVKHFPGHGHTKKDSHHELPIILLTKKELEESALIPFIRAIEQNVDMVMIGHITVPALDSSNCAASISYEIITILLRKELGLKGLIISDALDMRALGTCAQAPLNALLAGCDILLCPQDIPGTVAHIKQALTNGLLTMQELDDHVTRILKAKAKFSII